MIKYAIPIRKGMTQNMGDVRYDSLDLPIHVRHSALAQNHSHERVGAASQPHGAAPLNAARLARRRALHPWRPFAFSDEPSRQFQFISLRSQSSPSTNVPSSHCACPSPSELTEASLHGRFPMGVASERSASSTCSALPKYMTDSSI